MPTGPPTARTSGMLRAMKRSDVVVTGASRGIGKAVTTRLLDEGYNVWAVARDVSKLKAADTDKGRLIPVSCDLSDAAQVRTTLDLIASKSDGIFGLVNNAGVGHSNPIAKCTDDELHRTMAINFEAPFQFCRAFCPAFAKHGGGRVVNVASVASFKGIKYGSIYVASKHALLGLTRALALEYAQKNVTVNAVCPGWVDTDMLTASAENISKNTGRSTDEARHALAAMNPSGKLVLPSEVADVVMFLLTQKAAEAVTGAAWTIDGGGSAT